MHECTTPASDSPVQPLRRHHFSKQYGQPSPQRRVGGAIFTASARELAAAATKPQSPTLPVNLTGRKFWIVPDRSSNSSPDSSQASVVQAMESRREASKARSASQAAPNTRPAYNHLAIALQVSTAPFLIAPETTSERTISSGDASALASMKFSSAAERWLESRKSVLRERTFYMYGQHIGSLNRYFGEMKLGKIHIGHLSDYQQVRTANARTLPDGTVLAPWTRKAGPSLINHELSAVQQILKRAKLWTPIADAYCPLPLPEFTKPKVLDDVEERHLFAVAASRPEWELALFVAKLTRLTTAAGTELRNLRFEDVILDSGAPRIVINAATAKNAFRGRTIYLNDSAKAIIERCIERGKRLGSHLSEHYIFPFRVNRGLYDPCKPASSSWLRGPFEEMREAAGFPWLTPHCFRHMAITAMLEKGAAPETVRHIAGHVSEQMMRHYSHNRLEAQKSVLDAIDMTPKSKRKRSADVRAQQHRFMARGRRRIVQRRVIA